MSEWAENIAAGDLRALARAATAVENRLPEAQALLKELFPKTGRATIIGVTGSPGAGKISMQGHYADSGVFIRSMATRGWLGGLASATTDMALLLDAAGRDVVLVETVGVGQDEVEVARLADVTIVVLVPGMGDDVQAIKAGILEIADVFAINKSDQPGADKLESEIKMVQSLSTRKDGWVPPIVRTVAGEGIGIKETLAAARKYLEHGGREDRAASIWALRLRNMLRERLLDRFSQADIERAAVDVAARRTDPYTVVEQWME
jgi:LAO/AO transport system kinase